MSQLRVFFDNCAHNDWFASDLKIGHFLINNHGYESQGKLWILIPPQGGGYFLLFRLAPHMG